MLRGKRVAVTGGAGFIGSHVVERLAPSNDVVVLDNLTTGRLENLAGVRDRVEVVQGSILDPEAVRRALGGADTVFHLAAPTSRPESIEKPPPYPGTEAAGPPNGLPGARQAGVRR